MNPDKIFFTADLHFGHRNILKYCPQRPWTDVDEMNKGIIDEWNSVVPTDGHVFLLGDVAFTRPENVVYFLSQMNGRKYLIRGNHDAHMKPVVKVMFDWIKDYHEMTVMLAGKKQDIVLSHYPMWSWNKAFHGSWMLHGHRHGQDEFDFTVGKGLVMDVGIDTAVTYLGHPRPYSYAEVSTIMATKEFNPK